MRRLSRGLLPFLLLSLLKKLADAVVARPEFFTASQPNGESVKLRLKGDENLHWLVDEEGSVVTRTERGFEYSEGLDEKGNLVPSGVLVAAGPGEEGAAPGEAAAAAAAAQHLRPGGAHNSGGGSTERRQRSTARPAPSPEQLDRRRRLSFAARREGGGGGGRRLAGEPRRGRGRGGRGARRRLTGSSVLKNLVVPILFSDHTGRALPSQTDLDLLWNEPGGHPTWEAYANQSVREYYSDQSYGALNLNSTVLDWVTITTSESDCADGSSGTGQAWMDCLKEALELADASVNFDEFDEDDDGYIDAIAIMHSGYGAEYGGYDADGTYYDDRVWSHKWIIFDVDSSTWDPFTSDEGTVVFDYHVETALYGTSGSDVTSIGVAAHETGHFLGLPDLYDTDYSSAGIDSWGIMSNSWGWDGTGGAPPSFSAWCKYDLGWVSPTEIVPGAGAGTYLIRDVQTHDEVYMVTHGYPDDEYLLIENRQAKGADKDSPQGGLLIWHIDEAITDDNNQEGYPGQSGWPENGYHYLTALLQADGDFELEQDGSADAYDVFHRGGVNRLNTSQNQYPSSMSYQSGDVYETGFEITWVSDSSDAMNFTVDFNGSVSNVTLHDYSGDLTLTMYDSWGDGWEGTYFTLHPMDNSSKLLSYYTLADGLSATAPVDVTNNNSYVFHSWGRNLYDSEISWTLDECGISGTVTTTAYFSINTTGGCNEYIHNCSMLQVDMYDSWGDGWNGNVFSLYEQDSGTEVDTATFYGGYSAVQCLGASASTCYYFEVSVEGTYGSEVSWTLTDAGGTENSGEIGVAAWFCLDAGGNVYDYYEVTGAPTAAPTAAPTTAAPTAAPTTAAPTPGPTPGPTAAPTTAAPTAGTMAEAAFSLCVSVDSESSTTSTSATLQSVLLSLASSISALGGSETVSISVDTSDGDCSRRLLEEDHQVVSQYKDNEQRRLASMVFDVDLVISGMDSSIADDVVDTFESLVNNGTLETELADESITLSTVTIYSEITTLETGVPTIGTSPRPGTSSRVPTPSPTPSPTSNSEDTTDEDETDETADYADSGERWSESLGSVALLAAAATLLAAVFPF